MKMMGVSQHDTKPVVNVIPRPGKVNVLTDSIRITPDTKIITDKSDEDLMRLGHYLSSLIYKTTSWDLEVMADNGIKIKNCIVLSIDPDIKSGEESYELNMNSDKIQISGSTKGGIFYGIQTLRQIFPPEFEKANGLIELEQIVLPCYEIKDEPAYQWRGIMLDVSRHFLGPDFVKSLIDYMAYHKLNVFHWHLCDDQGWRLEIKKYPKLTEVGSWRVDREDRHWYARPLQEPGEQATYGGFYTQEEVRDIIEYAKMRNITIVPEIEMPGHTSAALAAYPQYSCAGDPITVPPGSYWPITDVYCAGNDATFEFLENVLMEVIDLFPGEYVHIGGDEVDKSTWRKCDKCQTRIAEENLKDEFELQSYFIKRIEKFLTAHNRKLIGWDEILEGGLAPRATVMSWRGMKGGIEAARSGHDVVMTPISHCYFNLYQGPRDQEPMAYGGYIPISKVYTFDPTPEELTRKEASHILGGGANLWAEFVHNPEIAEYMLIPRMDALCEVLWTNKSLHNWNDFSHRLLYQFKRYDAWGINYAVSAMNANIDANVDIESKKLFIELNSELTPISIHFTTDGSDPTLESRKYKAPIAINEDTSLKAASFLNGKRVSPIVQKKFVFHKATGKRVSLEYKNARKYDGGGEFSLTNSLRGSVDFADGRWKGFHEVDFIGTVDLEQVHEINHIQISFLRDHSVWIFQPTSVEFSLSLDGINFSTVDSVSFPVSQSDDRAMVINAAVDVPSRQARYVRVAAQNIGTCPDWHPGSGEKAWLFVDEIIIK